MSDLTMESLAARPPPTQPLARIGVTILELSTIAGLVIATGSVGTTR